MKLRLSWWHIAFGKGNQFYGLMTIKKHYLASLSIGNKGTYRSSFTSNSAGIKQACFLSAGKNASLTIGDSCGLSGTVISASESITLGDNVICGVNCTILDSDRHALDSIERSKGSGGLSAPIVIHNNVWLGMNVVVLKGVTIGEGAIIGANSVVCCDIPANSVAAGNPAKPLKKLV